MKPNPQPSERWLAYREVNPRARVRMFCFPYAGGGASAYRGWAAPLPPDVEVCPVQLPGREGRLREAPFENPASFNDDSTRKYIMRLDFPPPPALER